MIKVGRVPPQQSVGNQFVEQFLRVLPISPDTLDIANTGLSEGLMTNVDQLQALFVGIQVFNVLLQLQQRFEKVGRVENGSKFPVHVQGILILDLYQTRI